MGNKNVETITVMFPYPSGTGLHCGHWYNYAITDSYCRYRRYIGKKEEIIKLLGIYMPSIREKLN